MKVFALAVLLAVMQASPPVPRKATDSSTGASQTIQSNASSDKTPSTKPKSAIKSQSTQNNEQSTDGQRTENAQQSVRITELPTVRVAPNKKDWMDYGLWAFNLLLALTGGLQIWLLWRTFGAIHRQADLMDGQLTEMAEARKIQTKILILQYRPKLVVRDMAISDFDTHELGKPAHARLKFSLVNAGGTPAAIVQGTAQIVCAEVPKGQKTTYRDGETLILANDTLQPGQYQPFDGVVTTGIVNDIQWANFHEGLQDDTFRMLFLFVRVFYLDDLDIPRRTMFSRSYDPKKRRFEAKEGDDDYTD
jgi:hypothetical protein